jgi:hypothetical protein
MNITGEGLYNLDFFSKETVKSPQEAVDKDLVALFYPHGMCYCIYCYS